MTDLLRRLSDLAESLEGCEWNHPLLSVETCREAIEVLKRLPKDANGTPYTRGDVLRLTTDPQIRAMAVMCLKPLDDDGCVSYCTLAGAWEIDSTEQAARGVKK